jgi:Ni/Co efflux regulator RcnB
MKKLITLTIVSALAVLPILDVANAQGGGRAPAQKQQLEQRDDARIWRKGGAYRGKGARVSDYRRHKLTAPPKGHRWIRDGNSFLLVATASGVIRSIVTAR